MSVIRVWCGGKEGARDHECVLKESERFERLGIVCKGSTNIVDAKPDPEPEPEALVALMIVWIVLMEPAGEPGSERLSNVMV